MVCAIGAHLVCLNGSTSPGPSQEVTDKDDELKFLLRAMQGSLISIESKMDSMCARLDSISSKLEKHYGRLLEAERRISNA